jgi:nitroreductase
MEAIFSRRSIRKYKKKPIDDDTLNLLLKAGMSAPSAGNEQPWHFIVINDKNILNKIPSIHPYSNMLTQAPIAILICGDLTLEKHKGFWVQDCSAATENILIAASHLKLGSVWLGVYPRNERINGLQKLLGLKDHLIPFALLPIGYPSEKKEAKSDFDFTRVHYNKW